MSGLAPASAAKLEPQTTATIDKPGFLFLNVSYHNDSMDLQ